WKLLWVCPERLEPIPNPNTPREREREREQCLVSLYLKSGGHSHAERRPYFTTLAFSPLHKLQRFTAFQILETKTPSSDPQGSNSKFLPCRLLQLHSQQSISQAQPNSR
ncbi:hypothetical protein QQP08_018788, partial [Theobroma cacao]